MSALERVQGPAWVGVDTAAANRLLRNTYALLSATLLFSAGAAATAMVLSVPAMPWWLTLAGYFGLLFGVHRLRNSAWSIALVFALTGFMGMTLGPMIGAYLALPGGAALVTQALVASGVVFVSLSAYAVRSRRDFSFLGGLVMAGIVVMLLASIGAIVFELPALALAVSAAVVLLMAGYVLFETSQLVHGGETNYVLATVGLYVALFNLFASLLHLFGVFSAEE